MPIKESLQSLLTCTLPSEVVITTWAHTIEDAGPGALFVVLPALSGGDCLPLIKQALAQNAAIIIVPQGYKDRLSPLDLRYSVVIEHERPRHLRALLAARLFQPQPDHVVAVTGTNGKSSVAHFSHLLFAALDHPAASIGTLGIHVAGAEIEDLPQVKLTTPDPITFHKALQQLRDKGVHHVALEASSHGLDQFRLEGAHIKAAAFTNLTRDHLDYHGTMAIYFEAKARLFRDLLQQDGTAVINVDCDYGRRLLKRCQARGLQTITYGRAAGDYHLRELVPHSKGMSAILNLKGHIYQVDLPLLGDFQALNVLASLGLVASCGYEVDSIVKHLASLTAVPGRMQLVGHTPKGAAVVVDYAHTPDALITVLRSLRPHAQHRLGVVFGCGGDRDPGKRAQMGRAAAENADFVIITDDNPRSEDPQRIRAQVLEGAPRAQEVADRRNAIEIALRQAEPGDCIVIAGKGHEQGMIIKDQVLPFDDRVVAAEILGQPSLFKD
ncbi:MAG: UDP-N-acetylmuramoyl-L-alanyl-D-glutamate--2,6-diaminopimelate ligase [Holosporales bacterium]